MSPITTQQLSRGWIAETVHRPAGKPFAVRLRGHGLTELDALRNVEAQIRGYGPPDLRDSLPESLRDGPLDLD